MLDIVEQTKEIKILKDEPIELFIRYMGEQIKSIEPGDLNITSLGDTISKLGDVYKSLRMMEDITSGQYCAANSTYKTLEAIVTGSDHKHYWQKDEFDMRICSLITTAYFLWISRQYRDKKDLIKIPITRDMVNSTPNILESHRMRKKNTEMFDSMSNTIETCGDYANEFSMKQKLKKSILRKQVDVVEELSSRDSIVSTTNATPPTRRRAIIITDE